MRYRTLTVFGFAVFLSGIIGCAATRHSNDGLDMWSGEQNASPALAVTPYRPYGLSIGPQRPTGSSKVDEFNFTHPRVDSFVTRFQTNLRGFFSGALSRSGRYVPRMSHILEKEGVPQELAYLPLIESGFRTQAVSRAGAVGPWQLIPGTGRRYGLRIDRYVDERRDPVKSTQAAARYLKDLHDMFGDWHLSLAAYNTGEQNIVRILERERINDFWQMSERGYLYEETSDFVPEFLAALHIAETPEAYGFDTPSEAPMRYDLVEVKRPLPLSLVAKLSGTSPNTIKELNPALQRGVVPPKGYAVRVPKGSKETFEVAYASLKSLPAMPSNHAVASPRTHKQVGHHKIRRGAAVARASATRRTRSMHASQRARVRVAARSKGHSRILD